MTYLKVWVSFRKALTPFSDAEKGRLFDAMLAYADNGEEPHFTGNERFIWESVKQSIDLTRETSEKRRSSGAAGGNAAAANNSKDQQNIANDSKSHQEATRLSYKEKKGKEIENNYLDDDEDDDEESSAREVMSLHERAVFRSYRENVGRIPNPEEVKKIARCAELMKHSPEMAADAVRIAAQAGARNMVAYAKKVLDEWRYEDIRTLEEAAAYQYMRDCHADQDELDEARRRRKEAHEGGGMG